MLFATLGATETIGASCHFLRVDGTGILLDAGADPDEEGAASLPRFEMIHGNSDWHVDHAVVTHAHHDHVGSLPVLVREFPHIRLHMTRATSQLAQMVLPASARLQRKKKIEGSTNADPLFEEDELKQVEYLYQTHPLGTSFDLTGLKGRIPIQGRLFYSGHILGAAGVALTVKENGSEHTVFYTSDTKTDSQTIIPGGDYPTRVDTLIIESTMGADPDAEFVTRRGEERRLGASIRRVLQRGGSVLIPVFALGRAQELLALIQRFKRRGIVDPDVPVYTAGSIRGVSELYDRTRYTTPRLDQTFELGGVQQQRLPRSTSRKRELLRSPGIHVLASGMMFENTLSNVMAQEIVEHERHAIFLVGYARPDSPGGRLLEAAAEEANEVVLDPLKGAQRLRCDVDRFRLSGHSDRRSLLALAKRLNPERVIVVHGETTASEWLADNIRFFNPDIDVHRPVGGVPIEW